MLSIIDKLVSTYLIDLPILIIRTDNGLKFVPGIIVETANGSAVFVPSQVLDSPDGARLLKGQIVDTADGPRLLPPGELRPIFWSNTLTSYIQFCHRTGCSLSDQHIILSLINPKYNDPFCQIYEDLHKLL